MFRYLFGVCFSAPLGSYFTCLSDFTYMNGRRRWVKKDERIFFIVNFYGLFRISAWMSLDFLRELNLNGIWRDFISHNKKETRAAFEESKSQKKDRSELVNRSLLHLSGQRGGGGVETKKNSNSGLKTFRTQKQTWNSQFSMLVGVGRTEITNHRAPSKCLSITEKAKKKKRKTTSTGNFIFIFSSEKNFFCFLIERELAEISLCRLKSPLAMWFVIFWCERKFLFKKVMDACRRWRWIVVMMRP